MTMALFSYPVAQKPLCLTIGNFDGVHLGHKALIDFCKQIANAERIDFALITFWPHPRVLLQGAESHTPLSSRQNKLELLRNAGAQHIIELPFTRELASLSPDEFIAQYLLPLKLHTLIIGHDFVLGHKRAGTARVLEQIGKSEDFKVLQAPPFHMDGEPVSSTRLRKAIAAGEMKKAAAMLGRNYEITGNVGHGYGRGKTLGFPTANLENISELLPPPGVYVTFAKYNGVRHQAVTNIGSNPTFGNKQVTVETFLLDTSQNLYNQNMSLEFVSFLRPEHKFASHDELSKQINCDISQAREILAAHG